MGAARQSVQKVTIPASGGSVRIYDPPAGEPFWKMNIFISSRGTVTDAGGLDWEVFYGGGWAGTPFDSDHKGGISQASGSIAGGSEIVKMIYSDDGSFPANNRSKVSVNGIIQERNQGGYPIVLELTNNKSTDLTIYVTFLSRTVSEHQ